MKNKITSSSTSEFLSTGSAFSLPKNFTEKERVVNKSINIFPWFKDISRKRAEKLIRNGE